LNTPKPQENHNAAPRQFNTVKIRTKPRKNSISSRYVVNSSLSAPPEKDFSLRSFQIHNPEGEIHTINTSDRSSHFYGPVWTRIFDAYTKGEFLRGRVFLRCISRDDKFSGYMVNVDGVKTFLPQSKAHIFQDPEKDATNKCIALKVDAIYTNGVRTGSVIMDAQTPWKQTLNEFKKLEPGKILYALASDHEHGKLIFPGKHDKIIQVSIDDALEFGKRSGIASNPDFLTGLYWKLKLRRPIDNGWIAGPIELMV
jgi:hypothetical protein